MDQVVAITGADGGLGRFVTRAFTEAGARVAAITGILRDEAAAQAAMDDVAARFGRIDALIHLVGGFAGGAAIADTDAATFDRMIDVNLRIAFFAMRAAVVRMRAQGGGCIVAIGSRAAVKPAPGLGVYGASKAALVSLVETLAVENVTHGITANILLPGTMDTPANRAANPSADPAKWVPPSSVADLLVYLTSDSARPISGAVIPLYGGELC